LIAAAASGRLKVFAQAKPNEPAHQIQPRVWMGSHLHVANPMALALSGRFSIVPDCVGHGSLEARHCGAELLVDERQLNDLIKCRPPSTAALRSEATKLVTTFRVANRRIKMKRAAFEAGMSSAMPGASKRQISRIWSSGIVPKAWKKPGRRR
jgi:hypothetical protein